MVTPFDQRVQWILCKNCYYLHNILHWKLKCYVFFGTAIRAWKFSSSVTTNTLFTILLYSPHSFILKSSLWLKTLEVTSVSSIEYCRFLHTNSYFLARSLQCRKWNKSCSFCSILSFSQILIFKNHFKRYRVQVYCSLSPIHNNISPD